MPRRTPQYDTSRLQQASTRTAHPEGAKRSLSATPHRSNPNAPHARAPKPSAHASSAPARPKSRYIPSLDGLRAFAVLAVIAYHMGMEWAPGGLLGVTVFFVLSGYLITSLLVIEFQGTGRIDLPQFWLRRIRRLFPAIVFCIVGIAVLCTIFNHALLTKLRPDVLPSLLFFNNWWQIFQNVSYFDALGSPSPVTHFWSLAIEEQFYLVWPVLLFVLMKLGVKNRTLCIMTLVLTIASAVDMALVFDPQGDPSRVYYGTDTRAFSLLIGALLAFVWPSNQLGSKQSLSISRTTRIVLDVVGAIAFIGLFLMVGLIDGFSPFLYRGGLVLCSVLTAIVIAVMVHPASILGKFWGLAPFVWIGKRSYGIYLWHYPLLLLIVPQNGFDKTWWILLIALAVIFVVSAFSYTFVENPIRHGAIGRFFKDLANRRITVKQWATTHIAYVAATVVLVLTAIGGLIFVPNTSALEGADLLKDDQAHTAGPTDEQLAADQASDPKLDVLLIGDSVLVRTLPYFQETFPYGAIDSAINRRFSQGKSIYQNYVDQGVVGNVVVFALGINAGATTDSQIDELVSTVGTDKHIWFITIRCPDSWMEETNDALWRAADRYENVSIIDWAGLSASHKEWFDGDGTHLTETGAQVYINMINDAIRDYLPEHSEGDAAVEVESTTELTIDKMRTLMEHPFGNVLNPLKASIDPNPAE